MKLRLGSATATGSACLQVSGDLDYETTDDMVDTVGRLLSRHPGLAHLHLDLSGLDFCDSAGLSGLLLVHRRTCRAGVRLHLDHRPPFLERILDITGTLDHLTSSYSGAVAGTSARRSDTDPGETGVR